MTSSVRIPLSYCRATAKIALGHRSGSGLLNLVILTLFSGTNAPAIVVADGTR
jgi:hypothetical protein